MNQTRDPRLMLIVWRSEHGLSMDEMAKKLEISLRLLEAIEIGSYTHPSIANRIQALIGLTDEEKQVLISPKHRRVEPLEKRMTSVGIRVPPPKPTKFHSVNENLEIYNYVRERSKKEI